MKNNKSLWEQCLLVIKGFINNKPFWLLCRKIIRFLTFVVSLLFILGSVYQLGFYDITPREESLLETLKALTRLVFSVSIVTSYLFFPWRIKGGTRIFSLLFALLFFLSFIPILFARPQSEVFSYLWDILNLKIYTNLLLISYAIATISKGVISFMSSKINPALMFMASFAVIILVGTILLLLPKSTALTEHLSWVDALFVSTSSVCVTGLSPVEVSSVFTLQGQIIIMLLIQVGGLGVMTFTSFFTMFLIGNTSLSKQLVIKDMISSESFGSLVSVLINILVFTLFIEVCGAALIFLQIDGTMLAEMDLGDKLFFSIFHSVSAFCNAGFSTLPGNLGNSLLLAGGNGFYLTISCLIILGGIGFPILVNYKQIIGYRLKNIWNSLFHPKRTRHRLTHIVRINTKLVVMWTLILLIGGFAAFAVFEWNGAFAGMSTSQKLTQAFFNSASTRTAGFTSVNLSLFTSQSILIYVLLMWIGGGSQSTAGGIKVNVFAVAMQNLRAIISRKDRAEVFGREIDPDSIRKSNATILASAIILFLFSFVIGMLEPTLPFGSVVFECFSAIGTVGSSINITSLLGQDSKLLISALMFIGRIGAITFMMSFVHQARTSNYRFPKEQVIIN